MPLNKSPLGKKFENYSPASSNANFEKFEQKKRGLVFRWIIPSILLIGLAVWGIDQYFNTENLAVENNRITSTYTDNTKTDESIDATNTKSEKLIASEFENETTPPLTNEDETPAETFDDIDIERASTPEVDHSEVIAIDDGANGLETLLQTEANNEIIVLNLLSKGFDGFGPFSIAIDSPEVEAEQHAVAIPQSMPLWELGVAVGPKRSWQTIEPTPLASEYVHRMYGDLRNEAKAPSTGLNFSFIVNYNGFNFSAIRSGLFIDQLRFQENYNFTVDSVPVYDIDNTIAGYVGVADSSQLYTLESSSKQSYTYISLPLALSKKIPLGSKLDLMVNPKISLNMLLAASGDLLNESDVLSTSSLSKNNLNTFNFGYGLETGLLYHIDKRYRVGISAYYDRYTRPNEKNAYYLSTNHTYGVNLNLIYVWKWKY